MPPRDLKTRIINSKSLFIFCLFVLIFFTINLTKEIFNKRELQKEVNAFKKEIGGLEENNTKLTGLIEKLTSLDFVEEQARTKLNLKKDGENVLVVGEEQSRSQSGIITIGNIAQTSGFGSNVNNWWNYFFQ